MWFISASVDGFYLRDGDRQWHHVCMRQMGCTRSGERKASPLMCASKFDRLQDMLVPRMLEIWSSRGAASQACITILNRLCRFFAYKAAEG